MTLEPHELELHGDRVSYRTAGSGPALLLLHGIANSSETWERVAPLLSKRFTLIAPDLIGHGQSATPRGDYSLGAHASGGARHRHRARPRARDRRRALARRRHRDAVRLPVPRAQRAPRARLERRARPRGAPRPAGRLAAGRRLRAAGAHLAPAARARPPGSAACWGASGCAPAATSRCSARGFESLDNAGSRQAFLHTVRAVIEPGGQRVSAHDRLAPRRPAADADRVGRERLDHPGPPRRRRPRGDARQPLRQLRALRAHAPRRRSRTASPSS